VRNPCPSTRLGRNEAAASARVANLYNILITIPVVVKEVVR